MRICIITNGYPVNQNDHVGAFGYYFAHKLKELGHQVFVFTPDRRTTKVENTNVPVKWFQWHGGEKPLVKLKFFHPEDLVKIFSLIINGRREIIHYVSENNIDICLAMWAAPSGLFAHYARKKLKIPYAVWCLGSDIWIYSKYPIIRWIIKKILRKADILFADGVKLADDAHKLSGRECEFLPTSRVLPRVATGQKIVDQSKKNLLFIGRLEKVKGIDILLEAIRILVENNEAGNIHLYVFGIGTLENFVKMKIKADNLENYVTFKGFASAEDAALYLEQCDWLIIPSRNESIPVVLSDAVQMHRPIIVTDVGDMGYLVRKYSIGLVVPSENEKELAKAIKKAAILDEDYPIFKNNTNPLAELFDIGTAASRFVNMAQEIIKNKQTL